MSNNLNNNLASFMGFSHSSKVTRVELGFGEVRAIGAYFSIHRFSDFGKSFEKQLTTLSGNAKDLDKLGEQNMIFTIDNSCSSPLSIVCTGSRIYFTEYYAGGKVI